MPQICLKVAKYKMQYFEHAECTNMEEMQIG